ncbi:MAG: Eco57I restriction-modification methylase domain-containing protein, partial [Euryarchaeota archaeon]|nr:Eco57I restriction-modification methylase domain-containing protein [Euryarchaeota archaeon]
EAEMRRVNVFDWEDDVKGFGGIMRRGGFDCVVGNPPYLKIHHLVEQGSKVLDYLNDKYESSGSGGYDIYIAFVERGTKILRENGKFGFILPHKFFNASYGKQLRNYISRGKLLSEIVHFKDKQVFEHVSTYTCLLFLSKSNQKEFDYLQIPDDCSPKEFIDEIRSNRSNFISTYDLTGVTEKTWFFVDRKYTKLLQKLSSGSKTLGELTTNIFKGFDTGADKIYFMEYIDEDDTNFILFSKELQKPVKIEKRLMKKSLKGKQIDRFYSSFKDIYVLFPYNILDGKVSIIEESVLKKEFVNGYNYLKSLKSVLERRNKGRMKGTKWYAFTYPRNMLLYKKPKIFTPYNAFRNTFCFDENGGYYFTTGVAGAYGLLFASSPCDIKYFLGVLNSSIVNLFIKQIGTCLQGGYYSYEKRFIEKLPISSIDFSNPAEKAQHDKLVSLVDNMLELKRKYHEMRMEQDKELYERQIKIVDAQIDRLVYDLYGLTGEEIKVVEEHA